MTRLVVAWGAGCAFLPVALAAEPMVSIFSLNRTLSPVSSYEADRSVSRSARRYRWTYGLTLTAGGPIGLSGELGFNGYVDGAQKNPGGADFSYVLAYRAARWPGLKFGYENYGANQFRPDRGEGERLSNLSDGTWGLTWTLNKTSETPSWLKWHDSSGVGCSAGLRYSRHYLDESSQTRRNNRFYGTLGCKITLIRHAYLTIDSFVYLPGEQQNSNADFTWELGWNSYRHKSFAFLYRNYAANRFPWKSGGQSPRLSDGFVTVQWRYVW
ncbi:MAG: hypothetical protein ACRBC3_01425 [Burkholderiaceae bacterium]